MGCTARSLTPQTSPEDRTLKESVNNLNYLDYSSHSFHILLRVKLHGSLHVEVDVVRPLLDSEAVVDAGGLPVLEAEPTDSGLHEQTRPVIFRLEVQGVGI